MHQEKHNVNSNTQPLKPSGSRLPREGGLFILRVQAVSQLISTLVGPWLGVYFILVTASLSTSQLTDLMIALGLALVVVNIVHFAYAFFISRTARAFLDHLFRNKALPEGGGKLPAWNNTIVFPRLSAIAQVGFNVVFLIIPIAIYMNLIIEVSLNQVVFMVIGAVLSALAVFIFGFLYIDTHLTPVREALLPDEDSLQEIRVTISQRTRQIIITASIVLMTLLTVGGIGYQKITALFVPGADPNVIFNSFRVHLFLLGLAVLAVGVYLASRLAHSVSHPTTEIIRIMEQVRRGDYSEKARILTSDDMARLTIRFNQMVEQLQTTQITLERQVEERTANLDQRSKQLQAAAQVAREAASLQDLDTILARTVNLISQQFGFYHAGIFLLDETNEYAVLQAASSDGGKTMLARGHRLIVGQQGIVGAAAYHNKPRIALDVGADREFFNNPDLPLTRSEAAVPLTVHGKVIGVLDIQSTEASKFTQADIEVLQILADQVALAIQNARLFIESQDAISRLEATTSVNLRKTWRERVHKARNAYRYVSGGITTAIPLETKPSLVDEESRYLTIPINLRGQQIGSISLHRKGENLWSDADRSLVNEVSAQVGLALENARLVQDTQLRAEREQSLSQMTARIRETLDLDVVLQTAVREIKQTFNLEQAEVRLQMNSEKKTEKQSRQS
jgi:GAF domain-containing protein/HAMP domain-containing protein